METKQCGTPPTPDDVLSRSLTQVNGVCRNSMVVPLLDPLRSVEELTTKLGLCLHELLALDCDSTRCALRTSLQTENADSELRVFRMAGLYGFDIVRLFIACVAYYAHGLD